MSLGGRFHCTIRSYDQVIAAPRDPLLFFYPRCLSTSTATAPESHYPKDNNTLGDNKHGNDAQKSLGSHSAKVHSDSDTFQRNARYDTDMASTLLRQPSRPRKHALHGPFVNTHAEHELKLHQSDYTRPETRPKELQKTAAQNMEGPTIRGEVLPEGAKHKLAGEFFRLVPGQTRTMVKRVQAVERYREHNSITSSVTKFKGTWSYDWRIPLLELRQHFQKDPSPIIHSSEVTRAITQYQEYAAAEIPKPSTWSQESFAIYIKELALSRVSRVLQRQLYAKNTSHVFAIRKILLTLFRDHSMRPYLTPLAFENAMMFFYRYNMVSSCRELFNLMTTLEIPIFSSTFNLMLRAAAEKKDLHNFTYLLRAMIRMGVKPNENTWVAFVTAISTNVVKIAIIKQMRELGLLERDDVVQAVVIELLPTEITSHFGNGLDLNLLVEHLDSKYGRSWLSTMSANVMCRKLGELGHISEAVKILEIMLERGSRPDKFTLSIFLNHCTRIADSDLALRFLTLFQNRYGIRATKLNFHSLFMLGWRSRKYNMCRVVWRVACVNAAVTYRMQELVMRSLLRNTPPDPCNLREKWMKEAGKIVIGVDMEKQEWAHNREKSQGARPSHKVGLIMELATYAEGPEKRTYRLARAKKLLAEDLAASSSHRLKESFLTLLREALKMDDKWQREGKWKITIYRRLHLAIWTKIEPKVMGYLSTRRQRKVLWSRPGADAHTWDWNSQKGEVSKDMSSFP